MVHVNPMYLTSLLVSLLTIFTEPSISQQSPTLSLTEQLAYSTVRIEVELEKGYATGTGFFFAFLVDSSKNVPVIVTNKHVIRGAKRGTFLLTGTNADGSPSAASSIPVLLDNFESRWILDPDPNVDLAVMPIAPLLNEAAAKGFKPFFRTIDKSLIPTADQLKELTAVEDILMVGYPTGIWDQANNYPIFRKGITATHPANRYDGRDEFMIDAACYPGSSGSPVFLYNVGNYVAKNGSTVIGSRFYFLGVLYAGPQYTAAGEIKILNIPDRTDTLSVTRIPINLGNVVRSSRVLDFEPILTQLVGQSK